MNKPFRWLDAARARDFIEVLVLGYRDGAPQLVEAIYTTADAEFLRLLAVEFLKLLAAGAYPDTLPRATRSPPHPCAPETRH